MLKATPAALAHTLSLGRWQWARHLDLVSLALVELARRQRRRLILELPPRHGKSQLVSRYFPVWWLEQFPFDRIILASYEAHFAARWGRAVRNTILENPDALTLRIADDTAAADRWDVIPVGLGPGDMEGLQLGGMETAGVGGPITGKGANLFIFDDLIKNAKQAASQVERDNVWDWLLSTALTRIEPDGVAVMITTRWHEDDPAGRLQAQQRALDEDPAADVDLDDPERWDVIRLPAIAEDGDPLGRRPGEALWPERWPLRTLEARRRRLGSYFFSALFQQNPQPEGGAIFRRSHFRYYSIEVLGGVRYYVLERDPGNTRARVRYEARRCWVFQTCDPSATEHETSSYFVVCTWAATPDGDLLLLDVYRTKVETTEHRATMLSLWKAWGPTFQAIEEKFVGLNLIQDLRRLGLRIRGAEADTDKVARARGAGASYEGHKVFHPAGNPVWGPESSLEAFEAELLAFPKGRFDDQVDNVSIATRIVAETPFGDSTRLRASGPRQQVEPDRMKPPQDRDRRRSRRISADYPT